MMTKTHNRLRRSRNVSIERKLSGLMDSPAAKDMPHQIYARNKSSLRSRGKYKGSPMKRNLNSITEHYHNKH